MICIQKYLNQKSIRIPLDIRKVIHIRLYLEYFRLFNWKYLRKRSKITLDRRPNLSIIIKSIWKMVDFRLIIESIKKSTIFEYFQLLIDTITIENRFELWYSKVFEINWFKYLLSKVFESKCFEYPKLLIPFACKSHAFPGSKNVSVSDLWL